MELSDSFSVAAGLDRTWELLTEPVRVARCMPGVHLTEIDGDQYRGVVSVRLGVLAARFDGSATFDHDHARHRITVLARGDGNQGHAEAHVTARLEEISETETRVNVDSDLKVERRLAQLGKAIISEVSTNLTGQFADNLAASVAGPDIDDQSVQGSVIMPEPEALDIIDAARRPILKRLVPALLVVIVALVVTRLRRRNP